MTSLHVIWSSPNQKNWLQLCPGRTCTPAIGYFYDKAKISKEFLQVDNYLPLKYSRRQRTLYFFLPGPNLLQNLISKCKILEVLWT